MNIIGLIGYKWKKVTKDYGMKSFPWNLLELQTTGVQKPIYLSKTDELEMQVLGVYGDFATDIGENIHCSQDLHALKIQCR